MSAGMVAELTRTTFALPGGTFHALVGGDPVAPPLVYLHGFPDHPPTAAAFLGALTRTHRVIAPWLRGYAPSPLGGPYDVGTLAGDVLALIAALGDAPGDAPGGARGRPVDLVGHDWGAVITYVVCARQPAAVRRAVTLAVPHPLTLLGALRDGAQRRASAYMAAFQLPGAGRRVAAHDLAAIDALWARWSPGFTLDVDARAGLHACLAASLPAPLGYYRALLRPATARLALALARTPLTPPVLQLHGADDGCILAALVDGADARRFTRREREVVPGVGHFLQIEAPGPVAARIAAWLA